jgi:hypothetical protein
MFKLERELIELNIASPANEVKPHLYCVYLVNMRQKSGQTAYHPLK